MKGKEERETAEFLPQVRNNEKSVVREYCEAFLYAIILALIIRAFVFQAFKIPSGSMIPTLQVGDHILVNKFIYGFKIPFTDIELVPFGEPERGDIIVFKYPKDEKRDFIKRVIARGGDRVEIRNKRVYINGEPLEESYTNKTESFSVNLDNYKPITVPLGHLFMMGDNRDNSMDSRIWGFLEESKVKGKAFLIYFSWDSKHKTVRWNRLFNFLN